MNDDDGFSEIAASLEFICSLTSSLLDVLVLLRHEFDFSRGVVADFGASIFGITGFSSTIFGASLGAIGCALGFSSTYLGAS